jgi:hypothetical protein
MPNVTDSEPASAEKITGLLASTCAGRAEKECAVVGTAVGIGVGVSLGSIVAVGGGVIDDEEQLTTADRTDCAAFTIAPVVVSPASAGDLAPEFNILSRMPLIPNVPHADLTNAASPATCGAAIEVPDLKVNPFESPVL